MPKKKKTPLRHKTVALITISIMLSMAAMAAMTTLVPSMATASVSSVVASRMVISVAVMHISVETVLVGIVCDGSRVATWFLDRVFSNYFVSVACFLLAMGISGFVVNNSV
jgi:hypothetical protein